VTGRWCSVAGGPNDEAPTQRLPSKPPTRSVWPHPADFIRVHSDLSVVFTREGGTTDEQANRRPRSPDSVRGSHRRRRVVCGGSTETTLAGVQRPAEDGLAFPSPPILPRSKECAPDPGAVPRGLPCGAGGGRAPQGAVDASSRASGAPHVNPRTVGRTPLSPALVGRTRDNARALSVVPVNGHRTRRVAPLDQGLGHSLVTVVQRPDPHAKRSSAPDRDQPSVAHALGRGVVLGYAISGCRLSTHGRPLPATLTSSRPRDGHGWRSHPGQPPAAIPSPCAHLTCSATALPEMSHGRGGTRARDRTAPRALTRRAAWFCLDPGKIKRTPSRHPFVVQP
jgi:hypothetical protein